MDARSLNSVCQMKNSVYRRKQIQGYTQKTSLGKRCILNEVKFPSDFHSQNPVYVLGSTLSTVPLCTGYLYDYAHRASIHYLGSLNTPSMLREALSCRSSMHSSTSFFSPFSPYLQLGKLSHFRLLLHVCKEGGGAPPSQTLIFRDIFLSHAALNIAIWLEQFPAFLGNCLAPRL